ncbi:hypothetical protein [Candidatus Methylospira mobilis]|uniref:hypothetical protein n=1 Tax=Candidatus Methylospira mobilis TaxID=1808979 RepID=UPI00188585A6|nr:hypothetical protein [Candidatus Methylospira mobilis]
MRRQLHTLANELLNTAVRDRPAAAPARLKELHTLRDKLIGVLKNLLTATRNVDRRSESG